MTKRPVDAAGLRDPARAEVPAPVLTTNIETSPHFADIAVLEQGLFAFEEARLGSPGHTEFAVFLRDDEGRILGGIDGHIMWHRLFIKTVWLDETVRGHGHGSRLMAVMEEEAARRRCRSVWLTALGVRALHFYRRLGYEIFGALDDYVGGQSLYSVQKALNPPQTDGNPDRSGPPDRP